MKLIDFTKCKLSKKFYGGSERKIGILFEGEPYMLKFQKQTPFGLRYNTISEYIGSHIFQMLDINCQNTILGIYNGSHVVACKDFLIDNYKFVPFNDIGESTIEEDKEKYQYSYEDILTLLTINKKITNIAETISSFFDMYIVDALIGNFDRHGSNWGFLKRDNKYILAPVFDNGSCLFPNLIDEDEMLKIINDDEQIDNRVYRFPTSQIKLNNSKSSYFDVISSLEFEEINKSLSKIYHLINMNKINSFIDDINIISNIHKEFYKKIIESRYEKIIKYSYKKLIGEKNEII